MSQDTWTRSRKRACGLYRTSEPIEDTVQAGLLVYYHNHGDPGPGVYLPRTWKNNRAVFHEQGYTVPEDDYADTLEPLRAEGLYMVADPFYCCEKRCRYFEQDMLVQLGYNAQAEPILFVPEMIDGALAIPAEGTLVGPTQLQKLRPLKVAQGSAPTPSTMH